MNHTHHTSPLFLDAIFGICSVMLGFVSFAQVETTLLLSAIGGIFSVVCGSLARWAWKKSWDFWQGKRKRDKRTKRELLAYIETLEEELNIHHDEK